MRHRYTARRAGPLAVAFASLAGASTASAAILAWFSPVNIPQAAIDDDPVLADMQCWDIMVSTDGNWASAGMRATLPTIFNFYNHPFGGNTRPQPGIVSAFPALAFDTYVTAPADTGSGGAPAILSGFPETEPLSLSGHTLSVSWGDLVNDPPGTYQIARMTFPAGTIPLFHGDSHTSQVSPDSTTLLAPPSPAFANWITNADGSWHDGANWNIGAPPNGHVIVTLDVGGATVRTITHSQGTTVVHTINSQEHILLAGGTIAVANQSINVANGLTISGGALRGPLFVIGSPVTVGPGGGLLEGVGYANGLILPAGSGSLTVRDGMRLIGDASFSPGAVMRFDGSQTMQSGANETTGALHFDGGGVVYVNGGATLTVASRITMRGDGGTIAARTPGTTGTATLVNHGHITADVAGGSLAVAPDNLISHGSLTAAAAGAVLNINAPTSARGGAVGGDGAVRVAGDLFIDGDVAKPGAGALRVNGLFIAASGSALDLIGGGVVNDYATLSTFGHIRARIVSGYNGGAWDGLGIRSSTAAAANDELAVGYAEASALFTTFPATFMGESIDDTTVLVRLVRNGDANLDGTVNLADFNRLAANFGSSGAIWSMGDFNYDGIVNLQDFNRLASNFGLSASGSEVTPDDWANLAAAVPEPAGALAAGIIALGAAGRRRRDCLPGRRGFLPV